MYPDTAKLNNILTGKTRGYFKGLSLIRQEWFSEKPSIPATKEEPHPTYPEEQFLGSHSLDYGDGSEDIVILPGGDNGVELEEMMTGAKDLGCCNNFVKLLEYAWEDGYLLLIFRERGE